MTTSDTCNDEADEFLVRNADDMKSSLWMTVVRPINKEAKI